MNPKALSIVVFLGVSCLLQAQVRQKFNFNSNWKLYVGDLKNAQDKDFNDKAWKEVTLPHAYNQHEAFAKDIVELSTGICWYRKTFTLPKNHLDDKVFIEFEGVRQAVEIYVNGRKIALHENGAMAFGLDLSAHLNYEGVNTIALRIDNSWDYKEKSTGASFRWSDRNFNANYGGVPKNVHLHITPKLYQTLPLYSFLKTTGVYIYASNFNISNKSASIHAESEVINEYSTAKTFSYQVIIQDLNGNTIASFLGDEITLSPGDTGLVKAQKEVSDLNFWSWGYGYLYNVKTQLIVNNKVLDEVNTKTGFRKTEFKDGMVYLNDRVIQLKGYAQRTSNEWPGIGMSVPAWLSDYSNGLMVESNANLVRWMHITPWKQDVESCDRVGLIQAMPAGDAEKDSKGAHWKQRTRLMRDAIIYNRNNPSIIFYECGNESISEHHMYEMKSIRNTFDPHGGRAIGSREMLDSRQAEYGGEMLYINHSANIPMWAMEYSRDEGLRKYWDQYSAPYFHKDGDGPLYRGKDASAYNHNQDEHAIENVRRWFDYYEARPGTGDRVSSGGVNIIFSSTNTHHRGEANYRSSGETDPMRIAKDGFFAHKVMWNGWVDIEEQGSYILGHWNYNDSITKNVYVVSTAPKVELFLNGKSLGFGTPEYNFLYTFKNVTWQAGNLKAISYSNANDTLSIATKTTSAKPHHLDLKVLTSPNGFKADGADVALVELRVLDKNGNLCPVSRPNVNFTMQGEATWLGGIGDGINNNVGSMQLPAINGVNRVLIQSTTKTKKITVSATADDIEGAKITLNALKVKDTHPGFNTSLPGDDLKPKFQRGPTPETPSYTQKRQTVYIASAEAASNPEEVYKSYDDNELTEWTNNGSLNEGWIEYSLVKPSKVNQCVIKLTGWRTKQYPIKILADGKEVYKGLTDQSLGYITLNLKPTMAQKIRIELYGNSNENDAFDHIVEVDPTKELDLYKDQKSAKAKGQLRIVEVEFYESLTPQKTN